MSEEQSEMEKILQSLEELKNANKAESKDNWDKLAIIGQVIAGIFLVGLGLLLTWKLNAAQTNSAAQIAAGQRESAAAITSAQIDAQQAMRTAQDRTAENIARIQVQNSKDIADAQARNSKDIAIAQREAQEWAQRLSLDATNRQIASAYVANLTATAMNYDRAALINALDVALEPKYSLPLALRLSRPVQMRADICTGSIRDHEALRQQALVSSAAIALLRGLKADSSSELKRISQSGNSEDAEIARAVLRDDSRVLFRVSQIDDFVDVFVNNNSPQRFQFGWQPEWKDVTNQLDPSKPSNGINVLVSNTNSQGSGVRFEVRVGPEQYDRFVYRYDWSGQGEAFWIQLSLSVDSRGIFHLNGDNIQIVNPDRGIAKPCPGDKTRPS